MARDDGFEFDVGIVTFSEVDGDGFIGVQPGLHGGEAAGAAPFELHHPFGFASRPADPAADGECQVLYAWEGSRGHAWLSNDRRYAKRIPQLKKGTSVQYGGTKPAASFAHFEDSGTWTLYVPYDFSGSTPGKAMLITANTTEAGKESITILHGAGMGMVFTGEDNSITIFGKDAAASITLYADGRIVLKGEMSFAGNLGIGAQLLAWITAHTAANAAVAAAGVAFQSAPDPITYLTAIALATQAATLVPPPTTLTT